MKKIEVVTFLTTNSNPYAELLYRSMEKLKSGWIKIEYNYISSVGAEANGPKRWRCLGYSCDRGHNCYNHAEAMNKAVEKITGDIIIFIDADMCILYKNWDLVIINEMQQVDIFGTAFGSNSKQYNNFPNVFLFCFNKIVSEKVDLDFYPVIEKNSESPKRMKIDNDIDAKIYCKRKGDLLKMDTGCHLPMICKKFNRAFMIRTLGNDPGSQLPFKDENQKIECSKNPLHMAEWHYKGDLFCTHKQASRNHPLDGEFGNIWKNRIDLYTERKYGFVL